MGRGFRGCGSDGEFDGMACLDRVLAVIRERRGLAGTGRRAWHGNGDVIDGTDAGELETLAAWFHSLDLAGATGSSATSGLWTCSGAILFLEAK